jgi:hypothetical protein
MVTIALVLTAHLAAQAYAGPRFQRKHPGAAPRAAPARVDADAKGARKTSRQPRRIEVSRFAGDTVHATVWYETDVIGRSMRLHPRDLVGMTWTGEACAAEACEAVTYHIAEVAQDTTSSTMPQHGDNGDVWLYRVEYALASAPDQRHDLCGEDTPEVPMGIFVDGHWTEDGAWHPGGWTYSCPSGVISKCVRAWGYKPWKRLPSPVCGEVDLQPLHQACIRAARADYCGDGRSHTEDGTLIDMFDACGLNVREDLPGFAEESAFDEHGALWVTLPRWPTATPGETGWRFPGCERPRQAPRPSAPALVHVWSDPSKGRPNID